MANWRVLIFNCSAYHFISYWEHLIPLLHSDWVKWKATKVHDCRLDLWTSSIAITWDLVTNGESGLIHSYCISLYLNKMTPAGDLWEALDCMVCWSVYFRTVKTYSIYDGDENSVWRCISPHLLNSAFLLQFHFDEDTTCSRLPSYISSKPYCPSLLPFPIATEQGAVAWILYSFMVNILFGDIHSIVWDHLCFWYLDLSTWYCLSSVRHLSYAESIP